MKNVKVKNILLLCLPFIASAAMLTVIQAPISFSLLAWVALVPFILACTLRPRRTKPKRLAVAAYLISLCYWLGNLYWIAPITVVGWAAFCLYTAVLWPILALCLRYCRIKKIPLFLTAGVLFVGAERLQGLFLGGFFWRLLAHSQYQNITLIQIADIFGAAGLSFLIAMVNGLLAELILDTRYSILDARCWKSIFKVSNLIKTAVVCAALVAAIVYGRWRISQEDEFVEAGPLVASLQSNVPQAVKREALRGKGKAAAQTSQTIFDELMEQSKASAQAGAELIVWPETMVQGILNPDVWAVFDSSENKEIFNEAKKFDKALSEHSKNTAFVLVGAYGAQFQQQNDSSTYLARYNTAFLYRPDGKQAKEKYSKIHLVLFGEVLPFRKSFPLLFKLVMKFNPYDYDHSLDAGSEYTVFEMTSGEDKGISHKDTKSQRELDISKKQKNSSCLGALVAENKRIYKFSVMICYEATMPAIARRFALDRQGQKQIDWLINISNDGWFVRFKGEKVLPSTELPQHAAICAFRAVENRLAVLRSVNTGISCLIDTLGRVKNGSLAGTLPHKAMARKGIAGWFVDEMPIDKRTTFFSKYGQWLDFCCALCLVLLIIVPRSARAIRNKNMLFLCGGGKMKNKSKNAKKQKANCTRLIVTYAIMTYAIFAFGCNEPPKMQTTVRWPGTVSVDNLIPEATRIVQEGLADENPLIRVNAIEAVAVTKRIKLMPKVQRLLKDEFVPVRFVAALAVGDLEYSLAESAVRQLLKDENENVRIAAAYALSKLGSADSLKLFRNAIASNDQTVRANAALLLGKSGDKSDLTRQALWWTLGRPDSDDKVIFQTAEAIAMLGDERIIPRVWPMLISKYADVRVIGIRAMGALGTREAKGALITMLDDDILEVRLAAAEQLGALKDTIGEPEVLDVFTKNLTARLDKRALERVNVRTALAIGRIGTPRLIRFLPRFLKDESKSVRIAAAMAVFQCITDEGPRI